MVSLWYEVWAARQTSRSARKLQGEVFQTAGLLKNDVDRALPVSQVYFTAFSPPFQVSIPAARRCAPTRRSCGSTATATRARTMRMMRRATGSWVGAGAVTRAASAAIKSRDAIQASAFRTRYIVSLHQRALRRPRMSNHPWGGAAKGGETQIKREPSEDGSLFIEWSGNCRCEPIFI